MKDILFVVQCFVMLFSYQICHCSEQNNQEFTENMSSKRHSFPEIDVKHVAASRVLTHIVTQDHVKAIQNSYGLLLNKFKTLKPRDACQQLPDGIKNAISLCNLYEKLGIKHGFTSNSSNEIQSYKNDLENLLKMVIHHQKNGLKPVHFENTYSMDNQEHPDTPVCFHIPNVRSPLQSPKSPHQHFFSDSPRSSLSPVQTPPSPQSTSLSLRQSSLPPTSPLSRTSSLGDSPASLNRATSVVSINSRSDSSDSQERNS
jgi:hypothetical protein